MQREKWAKWKLGGSGSSGVGVGMEGANWVGELDGTGGTILDAEPGGGAVSYAGDHGSDR